MYRSSGTPQCTDYSDQWLQGITNLRGSLREVTVNFVRFETKSEYLDKNQTPSFGDIK